MPTETFLSINGNFCLLAQHQGWWAEETSWPPSFCSQWGSVKKQQHGLPLHPHSERDKRQVKYGVQKGGRERLPTEAQEGFLEEEGKVEGVRSQTGFGGVVEGHRWGCKSSYKRTGSKPKWTLTPDSGRHLNVSCRAIVFPYAETPQRDQGRRGEVVAGHKANTGRHRCSCLIAWDWRGSQLSEPHSVSFIHRAWECLWKTGKMG